MDATKRSYDIPKFKEQYENYIGGEWVAPSSGEYFECISPVDGKSFTKIARSNEADIELALDAAHAAFETWGKTSATERSNILLDRRPYGAEPRSAGPLRDVGQR